ncbi:MAG: DUF4838 domain-containing protein [Bacteroidales bacterium]|nr:DUF4838 domain-containing protein [Bacteroidales bacterium]
MSLSRFLSSIAAGILLTFSCASITGGEMAVHTYYIHPEVPGRTLDTKMSDYLKKHLQNRTEATILDKAGTEVTVHIGPDVGGDYAFEHTPSGYYLAAKDERTFTWLAYQFIKMAGRQDKGIITDDLPPLLLSGRDTLVTFPFEYRDLYMPTNQNPDMTYLLALHNLEMDWGIWGHNLSRVLGSNGDLSFGYQNMDQEILARTGGLTHANQFCFSSDKLFDLTAQFIQDQYGDGTETPYRMTIGPNDNNIVCMCRRCEAAGNKPGNAMPAVLNFVERLAARFPHHTFFIPGYSTTSALPDHPLPHNAGVFLSAIDYPRSMEDTPAAKAFFKLLEDWQKVTDNVYIWDYVNNFDDYLSPYPVLYVMQKRFQEYRKRGVKGIFLNGSGYFYSNQQEMYSFVLANLLLDPDADIRRMVEEYYRDAMPHIGSFYMSYLMGLEDRARRSGSELPLYGGMDEAVKTYLNERDFREFYYVFLRASEMEMTHRERVLYEKTRQFVSFSFLEMCRLNGLKPGGFAEQVGDEWVVKPEVWAAVEDLKMMTDEDDLYLLTDNENTSMDHMDRVNESGVYVADYENEVELWLSGQMWMRDHLLRQPLRVHAGEQFFSTHYLTDGVAGISQNYHWGWQIYPQADCYIELPAEAVSGKTGEMTISFLNSERHRMAPPLDVEIWADDRLLATLRREGLGSYFDEGERVIFKGNVGFGRPSRVTVRLKESHARNFGIDEIFFR